MNSGMMPQNAPMRATDSSLPGLDDAIAHSVEALLARQREDGHWVFDLEADVTIPAEYLLLQHYLGTIEPELDLRIARYLRACQGSHDGWPLYYGGAMDLSASV